MDGKIKSKPSILNKGAYESEKCIDLTPHQLKLIKHGLGPQSHYIVRRIDYYRTLHYVHYVHSNKTSLLYLNVKHI